MDSVIMLSDNKSNDELLLVTILHTFASTLQAVAELPLTIIDYQAL